MIQTRPPWPRGWARCGKCRSGGRWAGCAGQTIPNMVAVKIGSNGQVAFDNAVGAEVEEALAKVPADFRMAVILSDIEGMSYQEIADATGVPIGTVRSRIHRGRRMLRASLLAGGVSGP